MEVPHFRATYGLFRVDFWIFAADRHEVVLRPSLYGPWTVSHFIFDGRPKTNLRSVEKLFLHHATRFALIRFLSGGLVLTCQQQTHFYTLIGRLVKHTITALGSLRLFGEVVLGCRGAVFGCLVTVF